jgi:acetyl esterase/lipase
MDQKQSPQIQIYSVPKVYPMFSQDTALALPFLEKLRLLLFTPFYVVFGVSVLASSPILALLSKTSKTAKKVIFFMCFKTIIPTLRYFLDTVPTWLVLTWWLRSRNIAQDGLRVMKDVALGEPCHYGTHSREWVQCLHPCGASNRRPTDRHILFCHGGGHIAANCIVLMPSVTPWVRAGYTVWCMNYPLSPSSIFPEAVLSVVRCMKWLKKEHGVVELALTGDSAGGNLATTAAALVCNPIFLRKLHTDEFGDCVEAFPQILGVVSMYGLLDRSSFFDANAEGISNLEMTLSRFALDFIFYAYTGDESWHEPVPQPNKVLEGRCTLCDFVLDMDKYPKTLLVVGKRDVLLHSSRRAFQLLSKKGFECSLLEYDARHAFIGLPPALNYNGTWVNHSKPATEKIVQFFDALQW